MIDWAAIVREHGPLVMRTAFRLLGHDADANDCFQRTFLAAVTLSRTEPIRHWPAALRHLATATALQMLRTRIRLRPRSESLPETLAGTDIDPLDASAESELADHLRIALAELEPRHAELFCLVCFEGYSNRDAAEQQGITDNHAGVLLHRIKGTLREKLKAHDPAIRWRTTP